jgi:hypothetical protein
MCTPLRYTHQTDYVASGVILLTLGLILLLIAFYLARMQRQQTLRARALFKNPSRGEPAPVGVEPDILYGVGRPEEEK